MSQDNVELVRRLHTSFSDAFSATPDDLQERFDEVARDYGDEQFEIRLDPDYPEGEQVFMAVHAWRARSVRSIASWVSSTAARFLDRRDRRRAHALASPG